MLDICACCLHLPAARTTTLHHAWSPQACVPAHPCTTLQACLGEQCVECVVNDAPGRYLNAGTKMGIAKDFLYFLETFYFAAGRHHDTSYAEQRFWQDQFLATQSNQWEPPKHPRVNIDYEGAIFQVLAGELWADRCWVYDAAADTLASAGSPACEAKMYTAEACILHAPGPLGKKALFEIVMPAVEACRTHNRTCETPIVVK